MTAKLLEKATPGAAENNAAMEMLLHKLRRVQQRSAAIFVDSIGDSQVTPTQWAVLSTLKNRGALSQNQLGRATYMDPATTQGVILRLADRRLVERRPDPADRRRTSVSLTKVGEAFINQFADNAALANERALEPLNGPERDTLLRLLEKLM